MLDEGYIKFNCIWTETPPPKEQNITLLNQWRKSLFKLGLIGEYPGGIGFGNLSRRLNGNTFIISGTATGGIPALTNKHYSVVPRFDVEKNTVWCEGSLKASSESLSHAIIYETCPYVNAVFHIHYPQLWKTLLFDLPSTSSNVPYGTPEMAEEIKSLLTQTAIPDHGIFAMAGHTDGVIAFGENEDITGRIILDYYKKTISLDPNIMKCIQIKVAGKVQGVWFRASTRQEAEALGISGIVKNEADGSVYIEACGKQQQLEKFAAWCKQGPPLARVDNIDIQPLPLKNYEGFQILR